MSAIKAIRYGAWAAVAALVIIIGGMTIYNMTAPRSGDSAGKAISAIGGKFTLTSTRGNTITEASLVGKPTMLFFGYTFCPDVCPTTLYEMTGWMKTLGADADKLNAIYVSVDPKRDTVEVLKDYVSAFDKRIMGATGTQAQIDQIVKAYRVYVKMTPSEDGDPDDYIVDHTASVYLLDSKGSFVGTIAYQEDAKNAVAKLKRLLKK